MRSSRDPAVRLHPDPRATSCGVPYLAIGVAAVIGVGAYYLRSFRPAGSVRDRSIRRPPGWPASRRQADVTAFASAGRSPGGRGALGGPVPDHRLHRRHRLRAAGDRRGRGRRRGDLRWQRQRRGRRHRRTAAHTINSALYVLGISPFWDQAIAGFLLLVAIALDKADRRAAAHRPATEEFRARYLTGQAARHVALAPASGRCGGRPACGAGRRHRRLRGQLPPRSS